MSDAPLHRRSHTVSGLDLRSRFVHAVLLVHDDPIEAAGIQVTLEAHLPVSVTLATAASLAPDIASLEPALLILGSPDLLPVTSVWKIPTVVLAAVDTGYPATEARTSPFWVGSPYSVPVLVDVARQAIESGGHRA